MTRINLDVVDDTLSIVVTELIGAGCNSNIRRPISVLKLFRTTALRRESLSFGADVICVSDFLLHIQPGN